MLTALLAATTILAPPRPNIVLILADDVGYGDLSCYGSTKTRTPNLDRIAKTGIRFTDAHSPATVCTPTRYSLLTGQYAFRRPQASNVINGAAPLTIDLSRQTLPKMLQSAGYRTGIVGKWHLGLGEPPQTDYSKPITAGPNQVGFEYSFILPATGDRVPCVYLENGRVVNDDPSDPILVSYRGKVGNDPTGKENPELLKIKPLVGHADTIVNGVSRIGFMSGGNKARWVDEDMASVFSKQAVSFINAADGKQPFFLYLATHDVHAPLLPNKRFEGLNSCGLRGYALAELDWTVGTVLKALDQKGLSQNTIVIFTSDNGAVDNDGYGDPRENMNGHTVNGPLRGTKYTLYEGGHRVPFLLSWPAVSPAGQTSRALVAHHDLMASLAGLLGQRLTGSDAPDSLDLSTAFFRGNSVGRGSLVLHRGGQLGTPMGYRKGRWMILPDEQKNWELYDVEADLSQSHNLAADRPILVRQLAAELAAAMAEK